MGIPAPWDTAFGAFLAGAGMQMQNVPHLLAGMAASAHADPALRAVVEEPLHTAAGWVAAVRRPAP